MLKGFLYASLPLACWLTTPANADPIFVGGALEPCCTLSPRANNEMELASGGFAATAFYRADTALAVFGPVDFTTQPQSGPVFPISPPANQSFAYNGLSDGDTLAGTIGWTQLSPVGEITLTGLLTIAASFGDADFEADFPAGSSAEVTANLPSQCQLNNFANEAGCDVFTFEIADFEGAIVSPSAAPPVNEPRSLFMLLGAVAMLWFATRKRHRMFSFEKAV